MPDRIEAAPPRGVLPSAAPGAHQRLLPCAALAPIVAHFWWVNWQVDAPVSVSTVPHPCVHLVFEHPGALGEFVGVQTARFTRQLVGTGEVLGVKFRPGVLQAIHPSAATWTDRRVPSPSIWPKLPRPDPRRDLVARIERLEAALLARLRPLPPQAQTIRDVIERIEHARDWLKAEQIAAHLKVSLRTAQRRFQRHAGVSPKWVIRRYRLIEAADAIRLEPTRPFADLAVELGYFDQSHFTRDFAALIGQTPSAFAAAVRLSAPSSSS